MGSPDSILSQLSEAKLVDSLVIPARASIAEILDARDSKEFETQWLSAFDLIEAQKGRLSADQLELTADIRMSAFVRAFSRWNSPELAAAISEDFRLMADAVALQLDEPWINELIKKYQQGEIPGCKQQAEVPTDKEQREIPRDKEEHWQREEQKPPENCFRHEYGSSSTNALKAVFGILFIVGALSAFAGGFVLLGEPNRNPANLNRVQAGKVFGLGAMLLVGGIGLLFTSGSSRGGSVVADETGVTLISGDARDSMRWDEIATVIEEFNPPRGGLIDAVSQGADGRTHRIFLVNGAGRCLEIRGNLSKFQHLVDLAVHCTTPYILPVPQRAFEQGGVLKFGVVTINRQGMHVENDFLPWSEIEEVKIKDKLLEVRRRGKWTAWTKRKLVDVPNVHAMLTLLGNTLGPQYGKRG